VRKLVSLEESDDYRLAKRRLPPTAIAFSIHALFGDMPVRATRDAGPKFSRPRVAKNGPLIRILNGVRLLAPPNKNRGVCQVASLAPHPFHYGALLSNGVKAIRTPFFAPSFCVPSFPGVPAIWKAAYCASPFFAGKVTDHVAPLACFASAVSIGAAEGVSMAS